MTYQDESLNEPPPALVAAPALPAPPGDQALLPRPAPPPPTDVCRPRSAHARRQARRSIHVDQVTSPSTAAPTKTSVISMVSPPETAGPSHRLLSRVPGGIPASSLP
jgi:hypothetical protein